MWLSPLFFLANGTVVAPKQIQKGRTFSLNVTLWNCTERDRDLVLEFPGYLQTVAAPEHRLVFDAVELEEQRLGHDSTVVGVVSLEDNVPAG